MKLHPFLVMMALFYLPKVVMCQQSYNIKWIDHHAIAIKSVQAGSGFDDLAPLKTILKEKRIVALGEATHGTREFFRMKHRMLEFLVKEMGFRYFAIEANLTEAYAVNEYVMYGKGDPQKALDGLYFWTWNTREVMAMIEWMKSFNTGKPDKDKVRFYGFDMQAQPVAMSSFYTYLKRVDSVYAHHVNDVVTRINELKEIPGTIPARECMREVRKILIHVDENQANYMTASSQREFEVEKHNLVLVSQFLAMNSEHDTTAMCMARDSCMSENVKWLMNLEGDSAKFMLWAHNGHIAKNQVSSDGLSMGYFLKKFYRDQYYALGFDFYTGSFQSIGDKDGLAEFSYTLKRNSTGYLFSKSSHNMFLFDMSSAEQDPGMHRMIHDTIPSICIGALFSEKNTDQFYITKPLADMYDGLIFIRKTHRAEPNHVTQFQARADFGNLMSRTDAKPCIGKQFKFSAWLKVGSKTKKGQGQLWARVDKSDKSMGFFDNMGDRPVTSKEWQYCEITGTVDQDAAMLYFGCMLIGSGELFADDFSLSFLEDGKWVPATIPDPTFENDADNAKPKEWMRHDRSYKIMVTSQTSHTGKKCVKFK